jgi:hypothetical protein
MIIQGMERRQVYGKYMGIVTNTDDPLGICRIRAKVPSIYRNEESGWALPSLSFADKNIEYLLKDYPKKKALNSRNSYSYPKLFSMNVKNIR